MGKPGREAIERIVPGFRAKNKVDLVIVNGENAAAGSGLTPKIVHRLLQSGVDAITSGDHIWKRKEIYELLERSDRLIRPLNYPDGAPGKGASLIDVTGIGPVGVINLVGRVFMDAVDCPFARVIDAINELKTRTRVVIVDIHAEATSEKVAMGWHLDGKASAVIGTHTHIQTADEKVLPLGTAYITDCGMTGPYDSVIGRDKESILRRFLSQMPERFTVASEGVELCGVLVDIDEATGKARAITRVREELFPL